MTTMTHRAREQAAIPPKQAQPLHKGMTAAQRERLRENDRARARGVLGFLTFLSADRSIRRGR
jgi:hypothetical protein